MRASDLRAQLEAYGIRPLKDRSQNFLLDESAVAALAAAAGVRPGEALVEIGSGPGILTAELLKRGATVAAVELDPKLCRLLRERFPASAFRLIEGDALEIANAELSRAAGAGERGYRVAANLPYAITSATLEKFLLGEPKPRSLTLMLQREVADRILAKPGEMSSLAVLVQALARPRRVRDVPAGAFWPPPKVDSAIIHMDLKNDAELAQQFRNYPQDKFFRIVRAGFAGKRKQLKNSLRALSLPPEQLEKALTEAKISQTARPEELSVRQWSELVSKL